MKSIVLILVAVFAVEHAYGHLCLFSPHQRGTEQDLNSKGGFKLFVEFYFTIFVSKQHWCYVTVIVACSKNEKQVIGLYDIGLLHFRAQIVVPIASKAMQLLVC